MPGQIPLMLVLSVLVMCMAGSSRGLDEGVIAGTLELPSFQAQFGMHGPHKSASEIANIKSNIASMVPLGCILGAVVAFGVLDRVGRVRTLQLVLVIWTAGGVVQICAFGGVGQLYAGRFIAGVGMGMTAIVSPTYLAEVAPAKHRGRWSCFYGASMYIGMTIGYFSDLGTLIHFTARQRNQWVFPNSIQIILAGVLFIFSFFVYESPRWLFKTGQDKRGIETLAKIRGVSKEDPELAHELGRIYTGLAAEKAHHYYATSTWQILKVLFTQKSIRFRMVLALVVQLLAQWSGANAVALYTPELLTRVGVESKQTVLLCTSIFGVVKFVSTVACGLFIIDTLGRKRALYIGITLQFVSSLYICLFFAARRHLGDTTGVAHAGFGALIMLYVNGVGWSLGWNTIQYLLGSEIFPMATRGTANSVVLCFHYINQFANSKATPVLLVKLHGWGTMLFFAMVCLLGVLASYFFIPELSGMTLESVDELFTNPWYKIGQMTRKNRHAKVQQQQEQEQAQAQDDSSEDTGSAVDKKEETTVIVRRTSV